MSLLRNRLFASVAFSHLIVDILNSQRAILLVYLSGVLGLTNSTLGLISTLYVFGSSLSQPLLGYLSDRVGPRWLVAGGVLWIGGFFALAVTVPGQLALVFLVIAGIGSAAFHPAGTGQATLQGRHAMAGRETTAVSMFSMFGQLGYFVGPALGGPLLQLAGPTGLLLLAGLCLPVGLMGAWELRGGAMAAAYAERTAHAAALHASPALTDSPAARPAARMIAALVLVAAFQSMAQNNINTFLPKYLNDLGQSPTTYGLLSAMFMGGAAVGNVAGGALADRFGKRLIVMSSMLLSSLPLYLLGMLGPSPWMALMIPIAGLLVGMTYSVVVVLGQRLIPGGIGLASGLALGFIFSSGAVGTYFSGLLADQIGLPSIFSLTAAVTLLAGLVAPALQPDPGEASLAARFREGLHPT